MTIAIQFTPDGNGLCLHTDAIPLGEIGRLEVSRASTVEFDGEAQSWAVKIGSQTMYRDYSRQGCLEWERSYFNARILMGMGS